MSEFHVEVIKIEDVTKHPNADSLSLTHVHGGYPVVFKSECFSLGDKAVHIPVDALVPLSDPRFVFLCDTASRGKHYQRIKAKKLRGIFSMGMLVPAEPEWEVGQNVQELLRIEKYEPEIDIVQQSECVADPGVIPKYTDIEGLRKHKNWLQVGEQVVLTEKIHGANARYAFTEGEFWVGSRTQFKKRCEENLWWRAAEIFQLEEKLTKHPDIAIFGEVYGQVQDLKYGVLRKDDVRFRAFDAMNLRTKQYFDYDEFKTLCYDLNIPMVPVLYKGPWYDDLRYEAEGVSTLANHCREGFVAKPIKERWSDRGGRVILKMIGQGYLLRKGS